MTTTATTAARRPSRRLAKIVSLIAIPAAVAVSGLVVAQASYSAYSATTVNPTNNWATGTVALSDDDTNTAAFTAANLKPGATGTKCITVTSTGTLASTVKLYATTPTSPRTSPPTSTSPSARAPAAPSAPAPATPPSPTGATLYNGTLAGFGTAYTGYTNGLGSWAPTGTGTEARTYQITYTVNGNAPDTTQGGTAASASPSKPRTTDPDGPAGPRTPNRSDRGPVRVYPSRSPASTTAAIVLSGGASGQSQAASYRHEGW